MKKVRLIIALLLVVCVFCCAFGLAQCMKRGNKGDGGESNNAGGAVMQLEYELNADGASYSVRAKGSADYSGEVSIPDEYEGIAVTDIANGAFADCAKIVGIEIPQGVKRIGENAFRGCHSLASINIPAAVTSIGRGAFSNCGGLSRMSVQSENAKYYDSGNCIIERATGALIAGCKSSIIPSDGGVTRIEDRAFFACGSLTSVTIPDSVTSVGAEAFCDCRSLTTIEIPDSVTELGGSAFRNCSSLTTIEISGSLMSIGDSAFRDCTSLTVVEIPAGVTSIERYAFSGCGGLARVEIPSGVSYIGSYAFSRCKRLTAIELPSGVAGVGEYAFYDCSSLTIYCEADEKPVGWANRWNYSNCAVVWGCRLDSRASR